MNKKRLIYLTSSIILALFIATNASALAKGMIPWAPMMVVPGYLDDTLPPYLIADQNRVVHAFTSQRLGEIDPPVAVVYRQWTESGGWTMPVDISIAPEGSALTYGAFLDQEGRVHVIFRGGEPRSASLYYVTAELATAEFATAWSQRSLIGDNALEPGSAALTGDGGRNLVAIYAGNIAGNGVYAVDSSDGGESWSDPTPIFLIGSQNINPYFLDLYADRAGFIHAVWSDVDAQGYSSRAYYARFEIASRRWSEATILATDTFGDLGAGIFGPAYPVIIAQANTVIVMYNANGGPATVGRPALWVVSSPDGGETWSEPNKPFARLVGLSGAHDLVMDSNGVVHALFIQRIEQIINGRYAPIGGIWHSEFHDGQWSSPDRFDLGKVSGYDVRAIVSQGNTLLATWREDPGAGMLGVFYSFATLDAPELELLPLPTLHVADPKVIQEEGITSVVTRTSTVEAVATSQVQNNPSRVSEPSLPLLVGIVPAALLLAGLIASRYYSQRRR